jgi:hypothetical protein
MLELQKLLTTLAKISDERVLPVADTDIKEGDFRRVTIPVQRENPGDKTDQTLRRYAKDWIKKQGSFNVECRFQPLPSGAIYTAPDGKQCPVSGVIDLSWWPQPELSEYEKWEREKHANLRRRARSEGR